MGCRLEIGNDFIQLTIEQYGFEQWGFTYTQIFFNKYNRILKNIFDNLKKCADEMRGLKY